MYRTARTTPLSRVTLLEKATRFGVAEAARQMGVSRQTVYRWRRRAGELEDRPCRPHRSPRRTAPEREAALLAARLAWRWGPDRIGPMTGIARRTAYRILRRFNMHRLHRLFPEDRPRRGIFRASDPGEVVQIDTKSASGLTRGGGRRHAFTPRVERRTRIGWQYIHVAIDAASRRSYMEFLPGVRTEDCASFLRRAVADFDAHGIRVRRVLTDNGNGYKRRFGEVCQELGVRWTRTKPYHPGPTAGSSASTARSNANAFTPASTSPATKRVATTPRSGSTSTIHADPTSLSEGSVPTTGSEREA